MAYPRLRILPTTVRPGDLRGLPLANGNVDRFGRRIDYMRISLTDRCNLRCVYCMPAEGVALGPKDALLRHDEIVRVAGAALSLGFRKFRLTGGEPLVVRDIVPLVARLREATRGARLGLTTNAVRLAVLAAPLRAAGLESVNISLDTLRPERFLAMTRRDELAAVLAGIETALACFPRVKLNCVVVPGVNDDELEALAALAVDRPLQVRFIEAMPLDGQADGGFLGADAIVDRLGRAFPLAAKAPEDPRDAAHRLFTAPGWAGAVGVIAPRSQKFCASCNRLRLTPHGELKGCLLAEGTLDLRTPLREGLNDTELDMLLRYAIGIKP
ncbi:MAG TPA: GTP 3',8-cyclase MoaA, partial [Myxococcota bacterium]|nr:GTP 3',8-cyclase MoaA [Myxococcota bacterium]